MFAKLIQTILKSIYSDKCLIICPKSNIYFNGESIVIHKTKLDFIYSIVMLEKTGLN